MYKFNQSPLSFDEWIRLNDIDNPHILEACGTLAKQERIIEEQEEEIHQLIGLLESFDFKTVYVELDWIRQCSGEHSIKSSVQAIEIIIDSFKKRMTDI